MRRPAEFNDILNECLERLLIKGETIEQCLQSFPEHTDTLGPLLETTLAVKKASALQPSPEFKERARRELRLALQEIKPKPRLFFMEPRWAIAVAGIILFLLASGGTVIASGGSMPDEPLYSVKLATERVQLALTPSALGKAELYARLADKRVLEIEQMANENKPEQIELTARRLETSLAKLAATQGDKRAIMMAPQAPAPAAAPPPTIGEAPPPAIPPLPTTPESIPAPPADRQAVLRETLRKQTVTNSERLRALLETAPESAKPALLQAIAVSEAGYQNALQSLE